MMEIVSMMVRHCEKLFTIVLLLIPGSWEVLRAEENDRAALGYFESKIRPVLVKECYSCHSIEASKAGKLRGGLLLDTRDAIRKGGDSGPAVVPGQPDKSLLLNAIRHQDFEMPPKGKLPDSVLSDFERWITDGAIDPREKTADVAVRSIDWEAAKEHWAFRPLIASEGRNDQSVHPIDALIERTQKEIGVFPNPIANTATLIRRAWLDLLGIPPTPEECRHWMERLESPASKNESLDRKVWLELIDYLLESPHYGERWARYWIDVARFAESHGYEQDYDRPTAYHYRDFLIRAFNSDMAYDQFVRWQIAGDELAPEDPQAWMATGFLGGGAFPTQLTEAEFESARYDELDDMVATTGVAFLGLSIGCARCHDHKFDPISAKEYYQLASTFAKTIRSEKGFDLQPAKNEEARRNHQVRLDELRGKLKDLDSDMPKRLSQWLEQSKDDSLWKNEWIVLQGQVESTGKSKYQALGDGSYLAIGKAPAKDKVTLTTVLNSSIDATAFRLEALADESLPKNGPGRADNGNFALGSIEVIAEEPNDPKGVVLKIVRGIATHQQNSDSLSVEASFDDDPISGWAVDGKTGSDHAAIFYFEGARSLPKGTKLRVTLSFHHPNAKHAIGRMRFSITKSLDPRLQVGPAGPNERVSSLLQRSIQEWNSLEKKESLTSGEIVDWIQKRDGYQEQIEWFRTTQKDWRETNELFQKLEKEGPAIELTTALVTSEGLPHLPHHADGRGFPHFYPEVNFLRRGDVQQKGEVVTPGVLKIFAAPEKVWIDWRVNDFGVPHEGRSMNRTVLSRWISDPKMGAGGLAARVMINRLWQHHFGIGIVSTPNDFGFSGARPTQPELLEWLAREFVDGGWKMKRMHRLIMTSRAYMQSSSQDAMTGEGGGKIRQKLDPDNWTLWRKSPRRLDAEAFRDSLLAVSGMLDPTMYGPGTLNESMKRRSIYFFIKRSQLIPSMMLFDWPEHLVSIGQRSNTTIAPQALMLMNGRLGRSAAEGMATRLLSEVGPIRDDRDVERMIERAYAIAYARSPQSNEISRSLQMLQELDQARKRDGLPRIESESVEGASTAEKKEELNRFSVDCWGDYCQVLLSANEFLFID